MICLISVEKIYKWVLSTFKKIMLLRVSKLELHLQVVDVDGTDNVVISTSRIHLRIQLKHLSRESYEKNTSAILNVCRDYSQVSCSITLKTKDVRS